MFATRHNQENVTHLHQTTAAAKPLNQGLNKTPGPKNNAPKTPFRGRNDENAAQTVTKSGLGKTKSNLFVTPGPTKPRAVLGNKTTNAKALQTPGGQKTTQKAQVPASAQKISPRLKRSKVRIHLQTETTNAVEDDDDSAPEVEYCPPPSLLTPPLPDHPDDLHEWPIEEIFNRKHIMKNAFAHPPRYDDEDDTTPTESDRQAAIRTQQMSQKTAAALSLENLTFSEPEVEAARLATVAKQRTAPGTLTSRSAASALSRPTPNFAAPTVSTKNRISAPDGPGIGKENVTSRFGAAKAASKTTMGYSKGRQVSATKRAPLSNAHRTPVVKVARDGPGVRPRVAEVLPVDDEEIRKREALEEGFRREAMEDFVLEL